MLRKVARAAHQSTTQYSAVRSRTIHSRGTTITYENHLYGTRTRISLSTNYVGSSRTSMARFHSSPRQQALTPVSNLLAVVGGLLIRLWWRRFPPERRLAIKAAIARRKYFIYGALGLLTLGGFGYYYSHMEETPFTGRRRFVMFPQDVVVDNIQPEELLKRKFGNEINILSFDHPAGKRVHSIASNILATNMSPEFEGFKWSLRTVDQPNHINAFVLPTGDIIVCTGLVDQCECDEELAFILSHEIAHVVLRHVTETRSRIVVTGLLFHFIITLIWAVSPNIHVSVILSFFSRLALKVMLVHSYSRKLEMEADKVGLMFVARACYDPEKAAKVWKHLNNNDSGKKLEIFSTHPANETRLENLNVLLPEAYTEWKRSDCDAEVRKGILSFQKMVKNKLKKVFVL